MKSAVRHPERHIVVGIAEMELSRDPHANIITYSLGSCLGVAVYDPEARVGGILHAMLPAFGKDIAKARATPALYVNSGISTLFHAAYRLGAVKSRMIVKAAGGAQLLDQDQYFGIGERNFQVLVEALSRNGVVLRASAVGGNVSRTMRLNIATGTVTVSVVGQPSFEL